jgi:hypothetical protein
VLLDAATGNYNGDLPAIFLGTMNNTMAPFQALGKFGVGVTEKPPPPAYPRAQALSTAAYGLVYPRLGPYYSTTDFDSLQNWTPNFPYLPSLPYLLPGQANTLAYDRFPRFWIGDPPAIPGPQQPLGYPRDVNDYAVEQVPHPAMYNVLAPAPGNTSFGAWNLEAILRGGDTGADAIVSDLRRLLPNSFNNPPVRRVLTTHSFDVDRPGIIPWYYRAQPPLNPASLTLQAAFPQLILQGGPLGFPNPPPAPPNNGEFTTNLATYGWRSVFASIGKVDLNRPLPDYPPVDPIAGVITDAQGFAAAQLARQNLAGDIYLRLIAASGAFDPTAYNPPLVAPSQQEIDGLRFLAQMAANIVDYIDNDDYLTPFNWGNIGNPGFQAQYNGEWVFGTELPRLVINEVYVEHGAAAAGQATNVNVWVELYNPLREDPQLRLDYFGGNPLFDTNIAGPTPRGGVAKLQVRANGAAPGYSMYQVVLTQHNNNLRNANNVLGDPDPGATFNDTANPPAPCVVKDFTDPNAMNNPPATEWVYAGDNYFEGVNGKNYGFYLLGPKDTSGNAVQIPTSNAGPPAAPINTLSRPEMQYSAPANVPGALKPTVMLRRLACPHLPPNTNPGPGYNPYVTVDYVEDVLDNVDTTQITQRASVGRAQPYQVLGANIAKQQPQPTLNNQPQNTFFMINTPWNPATNPPNQLAVQPTGLSIAPPRPNYFPMDFAPPYDWLVHMDRDLTSPMELLHVSLYKPHELTQQFLTLNGKFQHTTVTVGGGAGGPTTVPAWFEPSFRLYRAFEYLETRSIGSGVANITVPATPVQLPSPPFPPNTFRFNLTLGTFDQLLSARLGFPAGVTAGDGAVWSIQNNATVIVGNQVLLATNVQASPPSFDAYAINPVGAVTIPFTGGRQPGKININTVSSKEVFRALCDAQQCNSFMSGAPNPPDQHIDDIFNNLANFRPFYGFGAGFTMPGDQQWTNGLSINNTLLASNNAGNPSPSLPRLFEEAQGIIATSPQPPRFYAQNAHPSLRYELLTKIFNNVTVRSNVFAVWCTVGFFQVDGQGRLGPEIGRADGRQLRHRFFAVIDRSALDPWVKMMNGLVLASTNGNSEYDVANGFRSTPNGNGTPPPVQLIIPLTGNVNFDPRKDYSILPLPGPGPTAGLPSGPPATVLHWTVIQ